MSERAKQKLDTNTVAINWHIGKGIGHTSTIIYVYRRHTTIDGQSSFELNMMSTPNLAFCESRRRACVRGPFTFIGSQLIRIDYVSVVVLLYAMIVLIHILYVSVRACVFASVFYLALQISIQSAQRCCVRYVFIYMFVYPLLLSLSPLYRYIILSFIIISELFICPIVSVDMFSLFTRLYRRTHIEICVNREARNGEVTKLTNLYTLYESVNSIDKTLFDTFNIRTQSVPFATDNNSSHKRSHRPIN